MGFLKDAKSETLAKDARRAAEDGRGVFTPLLAFPASKPGMTGGVDDWAAMVDAVEAEGWRLVEWSVSHDKGGKPEAFPLFRRA